MRGYRAASGSTFAPQNVDQPPWVAYVMISARSRPCPDHAPAAGRGQSDVGRVRVPGRPAPAPVDDRHAPPAGVVLERPVKFRTTPRRFFEVLRRRHAAYNDDELRYYDELDQPHEAVAFRLRTHGRMRLEELHRRVTVDLDWRFPGEAYFYAFGATRQELEDLIRLDRQALGAPLWPTPSASEHGGPVLLPSVAPPPLLPHAAAATQIPARTLGARDFTARADRRFGSERACLLMEIVANGVIHRAAETGSARTQSNSVLAAAARNTSSRGRGSRVAGPLSAAVAR